MGNKFFPPFFFFFFRFTLYNVEQIFSGVIIVIRALFQKRLDVKFNELNKLMIRKKLS